MRMYICVWVYLEARGWSWVSPSVCFVPPCFFRQWLSLSLKLAAWLHWPPNPWDLPVSTSCSTEITSDPSLCLGGWVYKINNIQHFINWVMFPTQFSFTVGGLFVLGLFVCLFILQAGFICFLSNCYYQGQSSKTVLKAQWLHVSRYQSSLGGIWEISGLEWRSFMRKVSIENVKENQDPASHRVSYL